MKKWILFAALLTMVGGRLAAQTMMNVITFEDEQTITLDSSISMLYFFDSMAICSGLDSDTVLVFPLAEVRKIVFYENIVTNADEVGTLESIKIYPNPVKDCFMIEGIGENCQFTIYSMSCEKIIQKKISSWWAGGCQFP